MLLVSQVQPSPAADARAQPANETRAHEARESRAVGFARGLAVVGVIYLLLMVSQGTLPSPRWPFAVLALASVTVGVGAFLNLGARLVGGVLLFALSAVALVFVTTYGPGGATGAFLFVLPTAAAVLWGRRAAQGFALASAAVFFYSLHAGLGRPTPWIFVLAGFLGLAFAITLLLGGVLRDFDRVFFEFEEASSALATAGRLRIAAEEARDKALLLRSESRSIEALGVVAGSVVHDLNNMAQVIRTWTGEILREETSGAARDAAQSIAGACDRVTTLAADVLALGQTDSESATQTSLAEIMPKATRALRRYVPESIRLVMDHALPDSVPPFPLAGADLVHLILEAAASLNVSSATSGTLVLAAPPASDLDIPAPHSGMKRYPVALLLELRRDLSSRAAAKASAWRAASTLPEEGKDVLCTSELCVLFFGLHADALVIVLDLFPTLAMDHFPPSRSAFSLSGAPES